MKDSEIVRALECCTVGPCPECPLWGKYAGMCVIDLKREARDLVKRLYAEIAELKQTPETVEEQTPVPETTPQDRDDNIKKMLLLLRDIYGPHYKGGSGGPTLSDVAHFLVDSGVTLPWRAENE